MRVFVCSLIAAQIVLTSALPRCSLADSLYAICSESEKREIDEIVSDLDAFTATWRNSEFSCNFTGERNIRGDQKIANTIFHFYGRSELNSRFSRIDEHFPDMGETRYYLISPDRTINATCKDGKKPIVTKLENWPFFPIFPFTNPFELGATVDIRDLIMKDLKEISWTMPVLTNESLGTARKVTLTAIARRGNDSSEYRNFFEFQHLGHWILTRFDRTTTKYRATGENEYVKGTDGNPVLTRTVRTMLKDGALRTDSADFTSFKNGPCSLELFEPASIGISLNPRANRRTWQGFTVVFFVVLVLSALVLSIFWKGSRSS